MCIIDGGWKGQFLIVLHSRILANSDCPQPMFFLQWPSFTRHFPTSATYTRYFPTSATFMSHIWYESMLITITTYWQYRKDLSWPSGKNLRLTITFFLSRSAFPFSECWFPHCPKGSVWHLCWCNLPPQSKQKIALINIQSVIIEIFMSQSAISNALLLVCDMNSLAQGLR